MFQSFLYFTVPDTPRPTKISISSRKILKVMFMLCVEKLLKITLPSPFYLLSLCQHLLSFIFNAFNLTQISVFLLSQLCELVDTHFPFISSQLLVQTFECSTMSFTNRLLSPLIFLKSLTIQCSRKSLKPLSFSLDHLLNLFIPPPSILWPSTRPIRNSQNFTCYFLNALFHLLP